MSLPESKLVKFQVQTLTKEYTEKGTKGLLQGEPKRWETILQFDDVPSGTRYRITVKIRYDDQRSNGHNSFGLTADIDRYDGGRWIEESGGCQHAEIVKHFPELEPFIKWHLMSTDGPIHYLQNTLYHAGDRDHWGYRKGEPKRWKTTIQFDNVPIQHKMKKNLSEYLSKSDEWNLDVISVKHPRDIETFGDHYTFAGLPCKWHDAPFRTEQDADEFATALEVCEVSFNRTAVAEGEGKEPDLEAARRSAVWPEASLEQLQDRDALVARLPSLMERFKADVESLGLEY